MPRSTGLSFMGLAAAMLLAAGGTASATSQDGAPSPAPAEPTPTPPPSGLLPIPDYSGDLWERRALLGDLWGSRTDLAEAGVQFGVNWSNTLQSVVSGGRDNVTEIGGAADYNLTLDLMKMNLVPGGLVTLRAESRYGESVNTDTGALLPASIDMFMPLTSRPDESVPITLTTLSYTQFLSDSFALFIGKFDTLDGDGNEFAAGRGLTQFQNLNFVFNTAPLLTIPYSTLGGGLIWKPTPNIQLASSVFTTTDASEESGFDNLDEGWTWSTEMQVQYQLSELPGGFNLGGSYAWDNDFSSIGRRFVFRPGEGVTRSPDSDDSWSMYASVWQYLFAEKPAENADAPLNLTDGRPDRKGLGVFARIGFADHDTNPLELGLSCGVGGRGLIPGRDDDLFGVGYFRNEIQTRRLTTLLGVEDDYQGFEAFYNIALTPAAELTFDVQVIEPSTARHDTAVVVGMRVLLRF